MIRTYWAVVRHKDFTCWELNPYRMETKRRLMQYFEDYGYECKVIYTEKEFEKLGNKAKYGDKSAPTDLHK